MSAVQMDGLNVFRQNAIKLIADNARVICAIGINDLEAVPSPCSSVCQMHVPTGWCGGCLRTLTEIGEWSDLNNDEKRSVWQALGERAASVATTASSTPPPGAATP